ncbi:MAG: hypothetical protein LBM72_02060 [Mycoplasmataceae bacterium]|nr:hypothetical protein [Mycoplasmataceae bacterium]
MPQNQEEIKLNVLEAKLNQKLVGEVLRCSIMKDMIVKPKRMTVQDLANLILPRLDRIETRLDAIDRRLDNIVQLNNLRE